jgi:hypothetical protein
LAEWYSRIGAGKLIGNFRERVLSANNLIESKYFDATAGNLASKPRYEKGQMLRSTVRVAATNVFNQQLFIIQNKVIDQFKANLQQAAAQLGQQESFYERGQQLIRKSVYDFQNMINALEIPEFDLIAKDSMDSVTTSLQSILGDYYNSNAGKLQIIKQMDSKVMAPKKSGKLINFGLSLVGMLRPPGFGNLQGYCGYGTSIIGVPCDFLLGIQNDGDSPEVNPCYNSS